MLAWSVKSVPGCLVLMVPSLIGLPVAATPGLGPHEEVFVLAAPLLVVALDELDAAPLAALLLLLLLELLVLPHPASASSRATTAVRMIHDLACDLLWFFTVSPLLVPTVKSLARIVDNPGAQSMHKLDPTTSRTR
jgi:hypothetical protein